MNKKLLAIIIVLILIMLFYKPFKTWYFWNFEHITPTFTDSVAKKNETEPKEDLDQELALAVGDTSVISAHAIKDEVKDNILDESIEKELDITSIKNTISGKVPESVYDKSINFKGVLASRNGVCGRSDEELLKATVALDSLLECEFQRLNTDTQVNYLFYKYFKGDDEEKEQYNELVKRKKENLFIESLPYGDDCVDTDADCAEWAKNGECVTNPETMLYKCAKSCRACALKSSDKELIIKIINSRPPYGCVYHGKK